MAATSVTPAETALTTARAACGVALTRRRSVLDRLQGGRMAAQAAVEAWARHTPSGQRAPADTTTVYTVAAGVDVLHGLTMLIFAALPGRRRHGFSSAALALAFAAGDLLVCRTQRRPATGALPGALLMEV